MSHRFHWALAALTAFAGCAVDPSEETADTEPTIGVVQQALEGCRPGPNQVALFADPSFAGSCSYLSIGKHRDLGAMPDNKVSSFIVGSNVSFRYCRDYDFGDGCVKGGQGQVAKLGESWNDRMSSAEVYPTSWDINLQVPPPGMVAIFEHEDFRGDSTFVPAGASGPIQFYGFHTNTASSLRLGPDTRVELCRSAGGPADGSGNVCEPFDADQAALGRRNIGDNRANWIRVTSTGGSNASPTDIARGTLGR